MHMIARYPVVLEISTVSAECLLIPQSKNSSVVYYLLTLCSIYSSSLVSNFQAAYLAKAGKRVVVLERRHLLGGASVTEEIVPGFKFSRASYLISLLRPQIVKDLELKVH